MKHKSLIICIVIVCIAAAVAYEKDKLFRFFSPKPHTSIKVNFLKTKDIDKLYTGFYLIPVHDLEYGTLKREMWKFWRDEKEVVKGYCKKIYDVSVGYDNLTDILNDQEVIKNACDGKIDKLPEPKILAVNTKNTIATDNYDGNGLCYRWDQNAQQRKEVIMAEMSNIGLLEKMNKRGRESLKTFATLFCE